MVCVCRDLLSKRTAGKSLWYTQTVHIRSRAYTLSVSLFLRVMDVRAGLDTVSTGWVNITWTLTVNCIIWTVFHMFTILYSFCSLLSSRLHLSSLLQVCNFLDGFGCRDEGYRGVRVENREMFCNCCSSYTTPNYDIMHHTTFTLPFALPGMGGV